MRSLIGIVGIVVMGVAAAASAQPPTDLRDVIVTTGEAIVQRTPDIAYITVAVETRAKNPRDAQRQNADAMAAVAKRLGDTGLARDALRTVGLRLEQEFDTANGRRIPREFLARNALEVTVADVNRAGEIADAAVQAGATSLDGIRFDVKDRAGAEREAIRLAVVDARARCEAAAAGAGRSVDRILKIEQGANAIVRPQQMRFAVAEAVTVVQPGLIEIRAEVTLTAAMR
jgi:uncharacterized protein YggE